MMRSREMMRITYIINYQKKHRVDGYVEKKENNVIIIHPTTIKNKKEIK